MEDEVERTADESDRHDPADDDDRLLPQAPLVRGVQRRGARSPGVVEARGELPGLEGRDRPPCIKDQELAGLDIVTDGQMHFDQYGGGIGSFVWYWYERLGGFTKAKLPNPIARGIEASDDADLSQAAWMHDWGGTAVTGEVSQGIPGAARRDVRGRPRADRPAAEGVRRRRARQPHVPRRPQGTRARATTSRASSPRTSCRSSTPTSRTWSARGADFIQIEDLGGWSSRGTTTRTGSSTCSTPGSTGVDAKIAWHCCLGAGLRQHVPHRRGRAAAGARALAWPSTSSSSRSTSRCATWRTSRRSKELDHDREVQVGVIDIRTLYIETDDEIVRRIHKVLEYIEPERVYLTTDCGLKALPRFVALREAAGAVARRQARARGDRRAGRRVASTEAARPPTRISWPWAARWPPSRRGTARSTPTCGTGPARGRRPARRPGALHITAQQISVVAALAIWGRFLTLLGGRVRAPALAGATDEELRGVGCRARSRARCASWARPSSPGLRPRRPGPPRRRRGAGAAGRAARDRSVVGADVPVARLRRPDVFPAGDVGLRTALGRLEGAGHGPDPAGDRGARVALDAVPVLCGCASVAVAGGVTSGAPKPSP